VTVLLRDLNPKVQIAAIETVGLLRTREAAPGLRDALEHARDAKVKRATLSALAMVGDASDHALFMKSLSDNDEAIRAAAAEGLGRIANPGDQAVIQKFFMDERRMSPRLALAFAQVSLGDLQAGEFGPLRYLINTLNLKSYQKVAAAYVTELMRDGKVRQAVYPLMTGATKDEKIQMSGILAVSGDTDSVPYLQMLQMDPDPDVAREGIRSLRALRARLP